MAFTLAPAKDKNFVDRKEIVMEMIQTLTSKRLQMGFALNGKRRIGKTSILKEVKRKLDRKKNIVCVYFSLWSLAEGTVDEFREMLSAEILEEFKKKTGFAFSAKNLIRSTTQTIKEFLQTMKISLKLKNEIEVIFSPHSKNEPLAKKLGAPFNLAENLARETNTRCILILDEFPSIAELKNNSKISEGIIKSIRTLTENYTHTNLCISGSIRKTMEITVLSPGAAFYRQFIIREIKPLEKKYVQEIITKNLKTKIRKDALDELFEFTQGSPFYVQVIGKEMIHKKEEIAHHHVQEAIYRFLTEEGNIIFREELGKLGTKERIIIRAMARKNINSPSEIAAEINEPINVVGRFLSYLEEKGIIQKIEKGTYTFEDPVFKQWLGEL